MAKLYPFEPDDNPRKIRIEVKSYARGASLDGDTGYSFRWLAFDDRGAQFRESQVSFATWDDAYADAQAWRESVYKMRITTVAYKPNDKIENKQSGLVSTYEGGAWVQPLSALGDRHALRSNNHVIRKPNGDLNVISSDYLTLNYAPYVEKPVKGDVWSTSGAYGTVVKYDVLDIADGWVIFQRQDAGGGTLYVKRAQTIDRFVNDFRKAT